MSKTDAVLDTTIQRPDPTVTPPRLPAAGDLPQGRVTAVLGRVK